MSSVMNVRNLVVVIAIARDAKLNRTGYSN